MKKLALLLLVFLVGCPCDSTSECRKNAASAERKAQQALDAVSAITSERSSPAQQAALMVLYDTGASADRKSQALQLLFELERSRGLDASVQRLDDLSAKLVVLLERKVEEDGR